MSISHDGLNNAPFVEGGVGDNDELDEAFDSHDETSVQQAAASPDRRADRRVVSAFRPGCVLAEGRMLLGIIRNLSAGGVMIELDEPLEPGTRVRYFWDETNVIDAVVAWSEGRRHGLDNAEAARPFDNPFPYRSVRVPCAMRAEIWAQGNRHFATLENLSLGGMRVSGFRAPRGALLTVRLGAVELAGASVRWSRDGETGIRFAKPLTRDELSRILSGMGAGDREESEVNADDIG
ncbi:PilZ domain-containing protein [Erythrobacter sp.]|uniref:PilZ domain-containing protein n=1 Tax=Erythrobacter sp. TaxID=1042 RepID=UPI001425F6DF|nr:PilZ domain-containing protein [Erythrobacter sp.]QIQ87807.1 MAG: PilZ domain-containing protein [Erythrobacter sp.]